MNNYDEFLKEKPKAPQPKKKSSPDLTWNLLSVVMVLMTLCACAFFVSLLLNPSSTMNPFPPPTKIPPPPTATWTPRGYDATWTPTVTVPPTETFTPRPTYTLPPTLTPFTLFTSTPTLAPTNTAPATRTPRPTGVPYAITVSWEESVKFKPDTSCASMYVAGTAMDSKNSPVMGLQVKLGGSVPGRAFVPALTTLTGISQVYGQSGFEFDLRVKPVASSKALWVQLFDQSGAPLSDQYQIKTYDDCRKNLILVRFQQK
jgi:hypothetical protein